MANLDSSKIKVYPTGYRGSNYNNESYVNSETNLNNLSSRLTYRPSYISREVDGHIQFVIDGYLFECDKEDIISKLNLSSSTDGTTIYAVIRTCEVEVNGTKYKTLIPSNATVPAILDSAGGEFIGVDFVTSVSSAESGASYVINSLPLYVYDASLETADKWRLIESSLLRFSTNHISNSAGDITKAISEEFSTESITADTLISGDVGNQTVINAGSIKTNSVESSASIKDLGIMKSVDAKVFVDTSGELKSNTTSHDSGNWNDENIRPHYVFRVKQDSKGLVTTEVKQLPYASGTQPGIIKLSYDNTTGVLTIKTTN